MNRAEKRGAGPGARTRSARRTGGPNGRRGSAVWAGLPEGLEALLGTPAVTGAEAGAAELVAGLAREAGAAVRIDAVGNVLAVKGTPRRALMAHFDHVGFMVEKVGEETARVLPVGFPSPAGFQEIELVRDEDGERIPGFLHAATEGEELCFEPFDPRALARVSVGDRLHYPLRYHLHGSRLAGPYLDDRLGCWAALQVLAECEDLLAVFTVGEEVSGLGASAALAALSGIEAVLVVDVTYARAHGFEYPLELGGGPVLCLKDSLVPPEAGVRGVRMAARRAGVRLQLEVAAVGASDAKNLSLAPWPVVWAFVGMPSRYNHRPIEIVELGDLEGLVALLRSWVG